MADTSIFRIIFAVCFLSIASIHASQFQVSTDCGEDVPECRTVDNALSNLESNTILHLENGTHTLKRNNLIQGLQNVSIMGAGSDMVELACEDGAGLSWVNVTDLKLSGFTLYKCGLKDEELAMVLLNINVTIDLWFTVPLNTRYAIVLGDCWNVDVSDFRVTNTTGLGILGVNVMGNSVFENVTLTYNVRDGGCVKRTPQYPYNISEYDYGQQIGGGAYFIYLRYNSNLSSSDGEILPAQHNLSITNSYFGYNEECGYSAIVEINFQNYALFTGSKVYTVGAGGGLSIFMTQGEAFNVLASISKTVFSHNIARYGGGAHVAIFAGVDLSEVIFKSCVFFKNGKKSFDAEDSSFTIAGGGLAVFTDMLTFENIMMPVLRPRNNISVMVKMMNTTFLENEAGVEGGGLLVYSLFNTPHQHFVSSTPVRDGYYTTVISINDCSFLKNTAEYSAAVHIHQETKQGEKGIVKLVISEVNFTENFSTERLQSLRISRALSTITSAIAFYNVFVVVEDTVRIENNFITGLLLHSTNLVLSEKSSLLLQGNIGQQGGGVHIAGPVSLITLSNNSELILTDNAASVAGGAIFFNSLNDMINDVLRPVDKYSGCFLSLLPSEECFFGSCFDVNSYFLTVKMENNIAPLGGDIFGSTLQTCTWTNNFFNSSKRNSIIKYLHEHNTSGLHFEISDPNSSERVSTPPAEITVEKLYYEVYPGETFEVNVSVYDSFRNEIPAAITSQIYGAEASSEVGSGGFAFINPPINNVVNVTLTGPREQNVTVYLIEIASLISTQITAKLLTCPQGFEFNESDMSCICSHYLISHKISCNLEKFELIVPKGMWIGNVKRNTSLTSDLVLGRCFRQYCNNGIKSVTPPDFDSQCLEGSKRTGEVCGQCSEGYSIVLGSRECKKCSNYFLFLIPIFGLLGILLFVMVAFLEVTIDKGWVYMIFFYCNVLTLFIATRIPHGLLWNLSIVPAYLISLEIGISICLYNGMTALEQVALKLVFPFYLVLLILVSSLLSKKISFFSEKFSPVKTFLTLLIMTYGSILDTSIEVLSGVPFYSVGGEIHHRWLVDANVVYFSGLHGFLVLVSIVLLIVYIIPVPIILIWPSLGYRYFKSLIPFLDALYAPYKLKYRFWLGVRLLLTVALYFIYSNFVTNTIGAFLCALILLLFIEIQLSIRPFKKEWVNILDSFLLGSIIMLILVGLSLESSSYHVDTLSSACLLGFGCSVIIGVLVFHFVNKYREMKTARKKITHSEVTMNGAIPAGDEHADNQATPDVPPTSSFFTLSHSTRRHIRINLRESLLSTSTAL